ncbi:peptide chain release factor N(5)-glutamine methyltransferase, partial [bacterium]|nr:peptide chain release factor N(5)-glutamine methyltransferase [bacterium]
MSKTHTPLTILEIINKTTKFFKQKDIEHPRLNAERLLAALLEIDRVQLYLQYDRLMSKNETELFRDFVRRRAEYEPLQYIIGETEFMGLNFKVTPAVLIPRPETEILIEKILLLKDTQSFPDPTVWDIGSGSGCIAVALAHYWPECIIIASDVSEDSLSLAEENASLNNVKDKIQFLKHDILTDPINSYTQADIIVSNPPYVSLKEYENLGDEIRLFEPKIALTDDSEGLTFYERIFS